MLVRFWFDILNARFTGTTIFRKLRTPRRRRGAPSYVRMEELEGRLLLTFDLAVNYSAGSGPADVVTADLNGDGLLDLATANSSGNNVSTMLGNENGTFQAAQEFTSGAGPHSVAVGDFNSDGSLDLVTANADDISVLFGNGDGTFQAPFNISTGSAPSSVAVGDLNNDGKLDLGVTSNVFYPGTWGYNGYYPAYYDGQVNVLLGHGDGSFEGPFTNSLGTGYRSSAVVADFNGDGKQDLASANSENGGVNVLLGNGTGGLGASINSSGPFSQSMIAGDFNSDGKVDLLVANGIGTNVSVLLGNGLGGFGYDSAHTYPIGSTANSVAAADCNGDGKTDLVTANVNGTVSVLLGTGAAGTDAFRPPVIVGAAPTSLAGLAIGHINGDTPPDIVVSVPGFNNVAVLLNNGTWPALTDPSITINDATVIEGNTGTTVVTFTVSLSAALALPVSFDYATVSNTALAGSDFIASSGTVTIAAGQTSQTFTVLVNGDRVVEQNGESFSVQLTNSTNSVFADATGIATITDDEPRVSIESAAGTLEGNSGTTPFNFTVTLSAPYDAPVTVDYSTADLTPDEEYSYGIGATAGVDYAATSGTLTFAPGVTSMPLTVLVTGDRVGETDEYFFVNLGVTTNAAVGSSQGVGSILDDEPQASVINSVSIAEGNVGTKAMTFNVTLSAASDAPVTVNYTTVDDSATAGVDYQTTTGTLTFEPGVTSLPITVLINGDRLGENDEVFFVNLTGSTGALILNSAGSGFIQNDEPVLSVNDVSVKEGNRRTKLMTFTVLLSVPSDQPVSVQYATNDWSATTAGKDYVATSGTLTFTPGQTSRSFTVTIKGDRKKEPDERFFISLTDASTNAVISNYSASGNILSDERQRNHPRGPRGPRGSHGPHGPIR